MDDGRRRIPRTDRLLDDPRLAEAAGRLGRPLVKAAVSRAQARARDGEISAGEVADAAVAGLPPLAATLTPVINATGVIVHTNLGRAPLSPAAVAALAAAAGNCDVEFDLASGVRAQRGQGAIAALRAAVPAAAAAGVVNNNAAALVLTATVLATGREIVISRGELIEIGDRFRLPDLLAATGARLREVGTTNRTALADYEEALGDETGFILKVHPSNYRIEGFTAGVPVRDLAALGAVPVVHDIGSGLLAPHPLLPGEPDAATSLKDGANLVTASGDKLLGGPQAGLLLGDADLVRRLLRHPLARALRVDKLTLAALEATLNGPPPPVARALAADAASLLTRARRTADTLSARSVPARVAEAAGAVGGGGAPGVTLPGAAVALPESLAVPLRDGDPVRRGEVPAVVGRVERGQLLLDLRSVDPADDDRLAAAVLAAAGLPDMRVIATAGHVDHGKSTLVRALTGMEPDRWAEERRRGMTIDLGYAWTTLDAGPGPGRGPRPGKLTIAFVDVPGHERFVPNMLAGLGPVPAVLFVVAADGGWMPQSAEHLAAIDALGVRHGLLAVTRADLADPAPATRAARAEIAKTSLGDVPAVAVSPVSGLGMDELRAALARLATALPQPPADAPVRVWIDRSFTVRGSGTVVTGTLPAGTVAAGDELTLTPAELPVRVRAIQSLGASAREATGVARVALNLRGVPPGVPARGMALVSPGGWTLSREADVRVRPGASRTGASRTGASGPGGLPEKFPPELHVHLGSARVPAKLRVLGSDGAAVYARLTLREPLPLHAGDRVLLRDPGAAGLAIYGATVLDPLPAPLRRRGAAAAAARELASWPDPPAAADLLRGHGLLRAASLTAAGIRDLPAPVAGEWLADAERWARLRRELPAVVAEFTARNPLAQGMPADAARAALGLPSRDLIPALLDPRAGVRLEGGYLRTAGGSPPPEVTRAVEALRADLAGDPFAAPDAERLRELRLDGKALAAAARAGLLLRVADQVVLAPDADAEAARRLARLPQPFTTSQARKALGTSRRVAIPLLEHLDRARLTERLPDNTRRLR